MQAEAGAGVPPGEPKDLEAGRRQALSNAVLKAAGRADRPAELTAAHPARPEDLAARPEASRAALRQAQVVVRTAQPARPEDLAARLEASRAAVRQAQAALVPAAALLVAAALPMAAVEEAKNISSLRFHR